MLYASGSCFCLRICDTANVYTHMVEEARHHIRSLAAAHLPKLFRETEMHLIKDNDAPLPPFDLLDEILPACVSAQRWLRQGLQHRTATCQANDTRRPPFPVTVAQSAFKRLLSRHVLAAFAAASTRGHAYRGAPGRPWSASCLA